MFGSTSPSYLILQSLDAANLYLEGHKERLASFIDKVNALKERLKAFGYTLYGNEHLKISVDAKAYGYCGTDLATLLLEKGIVCEFSDMDFVVMMLTPENTDDDLALLENALLSIPKRDPISDCAPKFHKLERAMSIREAMLSLSEEIDVDECEGRIAASSNAGCPPAVPIVVSGEKIDEDAIACMKYYGIEKCNVIK
jgi:arginine/lysine/ornithine decarboxylase